MNLGAEPKKMAALGVLALVLGYVFYTNVFSSSEPEPAKKVVPVVGQAPGLPGIVGQAPRKKPPIGRSSTEFRPKLPSLPADRPNPATYDPTLRLDLLAKVQGVELSGGARSLFQFSTAPPPPPGTPGEVTKIPVGARRAWVEPPPPPVVPPPPPPPPAITLKFYGYSTPRADGRKRAFFLDGDDIFVAAEGDLVKKRYRVVQIKVDSVVMEDTQFKNNRQTLVLPQEQTG